ncbi:MAG: dTDP-4-amino-4,6-dideoxygalactose transaminase [Anaerolineae bacterium]|nr:MAG: putative aminotransferase [Chloroflexi bacterium OLB13]MBV6437768.1 dTDP-4-amino-4,6-dideoxygalactose transaminase [Anaerolineae bacterium]MEB2367239.1 dTDP-4-amino-4,6-dideoxygalactose transaminase [Chloroflexota bacterium]MBW7880741.1 dTDP-4-amino-4,6-dideoxygalactose transaminase [Anaerolineae bacterium]MCO6444504.1 dTDP-4-amino-4,6-dideoxygalactose transaminase [Anaerolineae bacterium]
MPEILIPFNKPYATGAEFAYMQQAVANSHLSGDGPFTKRCHTFLQESLGVPKALLTTSCTHALEMSALLLDIQPGDEVICPSFTFVTSIGAFTLRGAKPVFADIRPDTLNIDESKLEAHITPRTKAIVVVHYAGVACEMDAIMAIAAKHGVPVVEDNAHALFSRYKGRFTGTFGAMATQSFHETKNFTCGEGGALLLNDPALFERAEIIREKGTNRSRFFRGQVDKYTWVDLGSSYLPSELLAAYLWAQFEAADDIQRRRKTIWDRYHAHVPEWAAQHGVQLMSLPDDREQSYHMYWMLLPSLAARTTLIAYLRELGIYAPFHYLPLHLSDMGRKFGGVEGDCPVTENVSDRLIRLPLYNAMTEDEQMRVIAALFAFEGW